jgi:hypothetical protein
LDLREKWRETGEDYIMRSFVTFTLHQIMFRVIKSRTMGWARHVADMGEMRNAYNILVGKPEGKRPLGRPRHRWEYNNRMYLREIGWEGVDWMHLAQNRD